MIKKTRVKKARTIQAIHVNYENEVPVVTYHDPETFEPRTTSVTEFALTEAGRAALTALHCPSTVTKLVTGFLPAVFRLLRITK